jgi:hypothetical protein
VSDTDLQPALLYILALEADELAALYMLLQTAAQIGELSAAEEAIAEKVLRLMEGR